MPRSAEPGPSEGDPNYQHGDSSSNSSDEIPDLEDPGNNVNVQQVNPPVPVAAGGGDNQVAPGGENQNQEQPAGAVAQVQNVNNGQMQFADVVDQDNVDPNQPQDINGQVPPNHMFPIPGPQPPNAPAHGPLFNNQRRRPRRNPRLNNMYGVRHIIPHRAQNDARALIAHVMQRGRGHGRWIHAVANPIAGHGRHFEAIPGLPVYNPNPNQGQGPGGIHLDAIPEGVPLGNLGRGHGGRAGPNHIPPQNNINNQQMNNGQPDAPIHVPAINFFHHLAQEEIDHNMAQNLPDEEAINQAGAIDADNQVLFVQNNDNQNQD